MHLGRSESVHSLQNEIMLILCVFRGCQGMFSPDILWRHRGLTLFQDLVFPCTGVDTMMDWWQLTQGGSKVKRSCQSTIVGVACTEIRHSDRNLRTAWFEKVDFKIGIKKKHWVGFYHYRMDVLTHFQHTFMFKQFVKWILHLMTLLNNEVHLALYAGSKSFHQKYLSLCSED